MQLNVYLHVVCHLVHLNPVLNPSPNHRTNVALASSLSSSLVITKSKSFKNGLSDLTFLLNHQASSSHTKTQQKSSKTPLMADLTV
ncbi:hypothetical protein L1887_31282 [Cichorium endivia]|nr:hypothetical protein L1887_31282 [Cichorium endivia]